MTNQKRIFDLLVAKGFLPEAACGVLANLQAESACRSNNAQDSGNRRVGMTDEEYTQAVDSGSYSNFAHDSIGYGLCQWTYWSRKKALLEFAQARGCSIADDEMQIDYLIRELASYGLLASFRARTNFAEVAREMMLKFEKPANNSPNNVANRVKIAYDFAVQFGAKTERRLPFPSYKVDWNQRQTSACVAFALTMAQRVKLYGLTRKWIPLAPLSLWEDSGAADGASVSVVCETLKQIGVENIIDGLKLRYRAIGCKDLGGDYAEICKSIDAGNPVAIALSVDSSFGKRAGGIEPKYPRSPVVGHAVCVIGYKYIDGMLYLVAKNSHGDPIGNGGIVYIPETRTLRESIALTGETTIISRKAGEIKIKNKSKYAEVDGMGASMPRAAYIKNNRLLVPVRFVADALGCVVEWSAETATASLQSEEGTVFLQIGSDEIVRNDKKVKMDAAPEIAGSGTMMIPARYIAEALNCTVSWDESSGTATFKAI